MKSLPFQPPSALARGDPGLRVSRAAARQKGELFGADQQVYVAIREAVMAQRLAPGTRLVEASLSDALGVSRAVVRMGLLRLAHDGIVELRPNRGAAIASPTLQQAHQVYEARRLLEGALAERLCGHLSRTAIAELRRIVATGAEAWRRRDSGEWIPLAGRFHTRLAELSGNPVIAGQVTELVSRASLITVLYMREGETLFAGDERLELLEALCDSGAGASRRARRLMEGLLQAVEDRLKVIPPAGSALDLASLLKPEHAGNRRR